MYNHSQDGNRRGTLFSDEVLALKGHLIDYAEARLTPSPRAGRRMYVCPFCGSGTGSHGTGAFSIDKDGEHFKCFSCGKYGDLFDLIEQTENLLSRGEAVDEAKRLYGGGGDPQYTRLSVVSVPKEELEAAKAEAEARYKERVTYLEACSTNREADDYYKSRGLTPETIEAFSLGYDPQQQRAIIPYPASTPYYTGRLIGVDATSAYRYRKPSWGAEPLFNEPALDGSVPVIITEGQLDAISVIQAAEGAADAIALGSTGHGRLIRAIRERLERWRSVPPLILLLDQDSSGIKAEKALSEELDKLNGVRYISGVLAEMEAKDANEALRISPEYFGREIKRLAAEAKGAAVEDTEVDNALNLLEAMEKRISSQPDDYIIKTPFDNLNEALDGGFEPCLVVLGAVSSLGKTAFALQLAAEMAKERDVLFFTIEMPAADLLARVISRLSTALDTSDLVPEMSGATTRDITWRSRRNSEAVAAKVNRGVTAFKRDYKHLYIIEGDGFGALSVEAINSRVERHISATGRRPVVFVDYLQIISPEDLRASDKQNTDRAVVALKAISRSKGLLVFAVSSFNRNSYNAEVNLASFKESGAIEYSADVLLGLQPEGASAKEKENKAKLKEYKSIEKKRAELVVLKNRSGRTGDVLKYDYLAKYHTFIDGGKQTDLSQK